MEEWKENVEKMISEKRYEEAILLCNKQVNQIGKKAKVMLYRSTCHINLGKLMKAQKDVEAGMKDDTISSEEKVELIIQNVEIYWMKGMLKKAIEFLKENTSLHPTLSTKVEEYLTKYKEECGLPYLDPTMEKIETFLTWMRTNGAQFDKIKMKFYDKDYRGVHTTRDILANELFLQVPEKLIITSKKGKETPIGKKIVQSGVELSWDYLVFITVFLLTQFHDESSFWKPYMDVYPQSCDSFPMWYSEEEKKMLTGTPMLEHIKEEIAEIKEEYDYILKAVPDFKEFSLDEYTRHKTLVISRIFYVKMHGVTERIMVPLADMFNHHYERLGETYWRFDDKSDCFAVNAQQKIGQGDPICENYGQKPNYRFLFYYGFLIEENNKNAVYVKLYYNSTDPEILTKEKMLGREKEYELRTFKFFEHYDENEEINNKFLSYLRAVEYKGPMEIFAPYLYPPVVKVKSCNFAKRKLKCPPLTIENEKDMLTKLHFIAEKCLKKYPESYEEDMKVLAEDKSLSFNIRNILILRSGEKKIYKDMMEMADLGIKLLDCKTSQIAEEYVRSLKTKANYFYYIEKILLPFIHRMKQPTIFYKNQKCGIIKEKEKFKSLENYQKMASFINKQFQGNIEQG